MELTGLRIDEFMETLASGAPTPGGGSVSALAGAAGAGLVAMVARLTIGRERYKEYEAIASEVLAQAARLQTELVKAIDRDTAAYNAVTAVFAMPRSTDEEKVARASAMQAALKLATETPFEVMQLCLAVLASAERLIGHSNPNAISDLGAGALNLKAGLQGAWLNVMINLGGITDEAFADEYKRRAAVVLDEGLVIADRVFAGAARAV